MALNNWSSPKVVAQDRGYFDFDFHLMLQRENPENLFVTRINTNTVFETVRVLELPKNCDKDILKDEIIILSVKKAR